ncbi:MAG TPA: hypothetical protein VGB17_04445, partial [Pyrinomonadaceae bacterium]
TLKDPFGHVWSLATRKENLSTEQLRLRSEEFLKQNTAARQETTVPSSLDQQDAVQSESE